MWSEVDIKVWVQHILEELKVQIGETELTQLLSQEVMALPTYAPQLVKLVALACVGSAAESSAAALSINHQVHLDAIARFIAACHFTTFAARVFDDIVDDDRLTALSRRIGIGKALLLGLASWSVGQRHLWQALSYTKTTWATDAVEWFDSVHHSYIRIAQNAFVEMDETLDNVTIEKCLERAAISTGLYFQMLFRGIALLVGASSEVSEKYAVCGYKLGTLYQLMNDLISCYAPTRERHSLVRKKVTLPVAYALCSRSSELTREFKAIWNTSLVLAPVDQLHRLEELVLLTGGVTATLMTMQGIYNQLEILLNSENEYDLQILQIAQDCLKIDQYLRRA